MNDRGIYTFNLGLNQCNETNNEINYYQQIPPYKKVNELAGK